MINAKRKGNNWERDCARKLSLIVSDGERDDIFWRTASSGALATISKKYQKQQGDLFVVDSDISSFDTVIECKALSNITILPLSKELMRIIDDLDNKYSNSWVLCLKIKNKGEYIIIPLLLKNQNFRSLIISNTKHVGLLRHNYTYLIIQDMKNITIHT